MVNSLNWVSIAFYAIYGRHLTLPAHISSSAACRWVGRTRESPKLIGILEYLAPELTAFCSLAHCVR